VLLLLTALLACSLPAGAGLLRSVKHAQREGDEHAAVGLLTEGAQTAQDLLGDSAAERTSDGGATLRCDEELELLQILRHRKETTRRWTLVCTRRAKNQRSQKLHKNREEQAPGESRRLRQRGCSLPSATERKEQI
jgi:hypothetical protein